MVRARLKRMTDSTQGARKAWELSSVPRARRLLMLIVLITTGLALTGELAAQDLSISVQQWSFFSDSAGGRLSGPGLHLSGAVVWGITPRLEAGLGLLGMLTPWPGDSLAGIMSIGYSLLSERWISERIPPNWLSMLVEAGVFGGAREIYSGLFSSSGEGAGSGAQPFAAMFVRFTPLVLGNPFYWRRDRVFSVGAAYELMRGDFSLFLNIAAMDFRILPR